MKKCATLLLSVLMTCQLSQAQEDKPLANEDLSLHSDGGPWRFYRASGEDVMLPRVLLIGDSIMNGFRGSVYGLLKGKANVDVWLTPLHLKSEHLHTDLQKVLEQGPYDVIHFNIGLHGWPKGRILAHEYEPLLKAYVETIRSHARGTRLIWASTTQITLKETKPIMLDPVNNQTIAGRNITAAKVMKEYGIPVNDLYTLMSDKLQLARGDGFHWSGVAYQQMAKQSVAHIKKAMTVSCTIVCPEDAPDGVKLSAKEMRRYLYLRTDNLFQIRATQPTTGNAIRFKIDNTLGTQEYSLKTTGGQGQKVLTVSGGTDVAVLYGVYHTVETMGVRFYIHGDTIPDQKIAFRMPDLNETHKPIFDKRGLLPFHDFPEGPDWWSVNEWKTVISQMTKMRMNFIGLHCYPKGALGPEPTVWIGLPEDSNEDGTVKVSDSTSWHNTQRYAEYGCYRPMPTSAFSYGGSRVFDADNYGPEINKTHDFPFPKTPQQSNDMFKRTGLMLNDIFTYANGLGIKTCVGTEAPLNVPDVVKERLQQAGKDPNDPKVVQALYEGMFLRIKRTFPIDYYWIWGYEGQIKENAFRDDFLCAVKAAKQVDAPFGLGISGWGWIASNFPRLDEAFPRDVAFSCISGSVGRDFLSDNFKQLDNRQKWAIPWFEDDGGMISPQLHVGRMRRDAVDARAYGCDGLMGLHWRTRILAPNISVLAKAGWTHSGWDRPVEQADKKYEEIKVDGGRTAAYLNNPVADTEDDVIYQQVRFDLKGYQFKLANGEYKVTLKFCEVAYGEAGKRSFGVKLQGKRVISELDVFAKVGKTRALDYTYDKVKVDKGVLNLEFVPIVEYPCIAAIVIEGQEQTVKVNCGGNRFKAYQADPSPETKPRSLPAGDFYRDWAMAEFGKEVAGKAAEIFTGLDGQFPRASSWNRGPGVIVIDSQPWSAIKQKYRFVAEMETLRGDVKGAGNLERFDYWLNTFKFGREMARLACARGHMDRIMKQVNAQKDPAAQKTLAREQALPAKIDMIQAAGDMVRALLAAMNNSSEMGTLVNIEQQSFLRCQYLNVHDKALAKILGRDLPAEALPSAVYAGEPRLIVPEKRTELAQGETLTLKVIVLDKAKAKSGALYWRELGRGEYRQIDLKHKARAVYSVTIPSARADMEYYIKAETAGGKALVWPATAPLLNHTVIVN